MPSLFPLLRVLADRPGLPARFLLLGSASPDLLRESSEAARILGVNYKTVQRHVDIFCGALVLREVAPMLANIRKRLRKTSKFYFKDSGLLHALLSINSHERLRTHRGLGASWRALRSSRS